MPLVSEATIYPMSGYRNATRGGRKCGCCSSEFEPCVACISNLMSDPDSLPFTYASCVVIIMGFEEREFDDFASDIGEDSEGGSSEPAVSTNSSYNSHEKSEGFHGHNF